MPGSVGERVDDRVLVGIRGALEARDLRGYAWDFPTLVAGQPLVCRGAYVIHNMAHDSPKARIDHYLRERGLRLADYKLKQFAERGFEPGAEIAKPRVLLVGEAAGIDIATGEGIAQAIEYGALAGPYLADAAKEFVKDNTHTGPVRGLQLYDTTQQAAPVVVFDPHPTNPFAHVPKVLAMAWTAALSPLLVGAFLILGGRRGGLVPPRVRLVAVAACLAASVYLLMLYGRASYGVALTFRIALTVLYMGIAGLALQAWLNRDRVWWFAVPALAAAGYFLFPFFRFF